MLGPGVSILANHCTQEQEAEPGDRALHQGTEDLAELQFPLSHTCAAMWEKTVCSQLSSCRHGVNVRVI